MMKIFHEFHYLKNRELKGIILYEDSFFFSSSSVMNFCMSELPTVTQTWYCIISLKLYELIE